MNEIVTIFIMYHIFCFTDWVPDVNVKYNLGFSCLFFNFANLGYNLAILLGHQFIHIRWKLRQTTVKYKFQKNRKRVKKDFENDTTFGQRRKANRKKWLKEEKKRQRRGLQEKSSSEEEIWE